MSRKKPVTTQDKSSSSNRLLNSTQPSLKLVLSRKSQSQEDDDIAEIKSNSSATEKQSKDARSKRKESDKSERSSKNLLMII